MKDLSILKSKKLARISLAEAEIEEFSLKINSLFSWEKGITKLAAEEIKSPDADIHKEKLFTFSFEEESKFDEITSYTDTELGYFIVPKVLE
ncbi:putative glutamyl-tRNA(Gln) amidotransferase, C subunit [Neorickettsia helminthoeca str. Oregon]|uniref:Putative glutamyl-tRNA(Gln) amidotransferase, C subunit n=1 Tax=Neorickettsia helminthoeca str. Oregon TaxID=1286528 RepID=X5GWL0_9RICK|nr:hypothetical protein [Neorickettsia helminthoeca]AHX11432.1 putative glutamyl-tRNA(Gln) amidotransferase, C subunit [Neorickettsia helminthoeca str. Oregon]